MHEKAVARAVALLRALLPRAGGGERGGRRSRWMRTRGRRCSRQNADSRLPMASTTKIMTALVALGEGDLDRVYTVKAGVRGRGRLVDVPRKRARGCRCATRFTACMLASGNDAAAAVAGECGGMSAPLWAR